MVLVVEDNGHVGAHALNLYSDAERIAAFEREHVAALTAQHRTAIRYLRALDRASKRVTWTVTAGHDAPQQTPEEQGRLFSAVVADKLRKG
jgi:hypothetical protein